MYVDIQCIYKKIHTNKSRHNQLMQYKSLKKNISKYVHVFFCMKSLLYIVFTNHFTNNYNKKITEAT